MHRERDHACPASNRIHFKAGVKKSGERPHEYGKKGSVSVEDTVRLVLHRLCWKPSQVPSTLVRIHRRAIVVREIRSRSRSRSRTRTRTRSRSYGVNRSRSRRY